ncbi:MAG: DNA replication and repair protein RecF [Bacteroidaceae bacterium]|nr:DNA replication and repair protein RecF [Bacteroidaceae bacterium]
MILNRLTVVNFKNIVQADLELSPKMNCLVGRNGMGKTNLLDAVYYLSFCRSASNPIDSQVMFHDSDYCVVQGHYVADDGEPCDVFCGVKRGQRKQVKRNGKAYARYSEHLGLIPLVMVSPSDAALIAGGSEERRRFLDVAISQYDREYLWSLNRYEKALVQRNSMLKQEEEPDWEVMGLWEEMMAEEGCVIYEKRKAFVTQFTPIFQEYYSLISEGKEGVSLTYQSHGDRGDLLKVIRDGRAKERILGYSLHGTHKDDLDMKLGDYPIKREGSQGQNKTYLVALKLAQFEFLKRASHTTPLLLLDDIFDRLDASRVEQIVRLVSGDRFGQIFVTDVNRGNMDKMLAAVGGDYKLFNVEKGQITENKSV